MCFRRARTLTDRVRHNLSPALRMNMTNPVNEALARRRRLAELLATIGMITVGVGMLLPLLNMLNTGILYTCRWVFAAGALLFWIGRCIPVGAPDESVRLRRLRRMEFWSGACFGVAAFFWFYNLSKYGNIPTTGALMVLRDTILFSLAGAVLQLISAWMIYFRQKKEANAPASQHRGKKGGK